MQVCPYNGRAGFFIILTFSLKRPDGVGAFSDHFLAGTKKRDRVASVSFLDKSLFRILFFLFCRSSSRGSRSSLIGRSSSRSSGRSSRSLRSRSSSRSSGRSFSRGLGRFLSAANERNRAQEEQGSEKFFHDSNAVLVSNKRMLQLFSMLQLVQLTNNKQNRRFFKKTH